MSTLIRAIAAGFSALLVAAGLTAPAQADVGVRGSTASWLSVRSEKPSANQLERQFAAFWNPSIPMGPKLAVTYKGDTPKVQKSVKSVMAMSSSYDFFSISGRFSSPTITGNRMKARGEGVMAGFPATSMNFYYIREGGLWKFDWKKICTDFKCNGNPDWGY